MTPACDKGRFRRPRASEFFVFRVNPSSSNAYAADGPLAIRRCVPSTSSRRRLDLNVDARRQRQLVQRVNRLAGRLNDVDQPLVGTNFKLLARLLVDMRAAKHGISLNPCRQRDRSVNDSSRSLGRVDDFRRRLVENGMVVRFHPNSNPFLTPTRHSKSPQQKAYAHSAHLPALRETRNGSDAPMLCQETQLQIPCKFPR